MANPKAKLLKRISAVLLLSALIFFGQSPALITLFAAALHESGHIAAIRLCGGRLQKIRLTLSGAEIDAALWQLGRGQRAFVYSAGALMNLITGALGLWLGLNGFAAASFALGIVNLLPVRMLDGGCLIAELIGHESRALDVLTGGIIFALWLCAVILLLFTGSMSLWVFTSYLFANVYLRGEKHPRHSVGHKNR